jgi:hypothetical protein
MSRGITIFDNSSRDFPYISGAQRLDLFLIHKFAGRTLMQTPPSIQIVFESRSKLSRYTNPGTRTVELTVDGKTIVQAGLALDKSTPIGLVTWENLSYDLSLTKANELLTARNSATVTLGNITHDLTASELAVFKDFLDALRMSNTTEWRSPQKACALFADVGIRTQPYQYVGMNTFGCYASGVPLPAGSGNSVIFRPEGCAQKMPLAVTFLRTLFTSFVKIELLLQKGCEPEFTGSPTTVKTTINLHARIELSGRVSESVSLVAQQTRPQRSFHES